MLKWKTLFKCVQSQLNDGECAKKKIAGLGFAVNFQKN